jgi:hypothetical protein
MGYFSLILFGDFHSVSTAVSMGSNSHLRCGCLPTDNSERRSFSSDVHRGVQLGFVVTKSGGRWANNFSRVADFGQQTIQQLSGQDIRLFFLARREGRSPMVLQR